MSAGQDMSIVSSTDHRRSDQDTRTHPAPDVRRAAHLRIPTVLLVMAGGVVGTLARYLVAQIEPAHTVFPWATFTVNMVGAFVLGCLLEHLSHAAPSAAHDRIRLGVGTGVMGGFTTYSTFAVGAATLLADGHPEIGVIYALGTVILGAAAAFAGIAASIRVSSRSDR